MVQYGNAFSVMELYKMPTYLRLFYYKKLVDSKKEENEATKQAQRQSKVRIKR
jgi:hypothetical protein